jgi:pyruvate-formate lyase-activating enzyme
MMAIWLLLLIVLTIFILQARKRHLKVMSDMTRIENQLRVRVKRNMANYNRSMTLTEIKTQLIKRNIAKEEEIKKIFESLINYKYSDQQIDLSSIDILIKKILP